MKKKDTEGSIGIFGRTLTKQSVRRSVGPAYFLTYCAFIFSIYCAFIYSTYCAFIFSTYCAFIYSTYCAFIYSTRTPKLGWCREATAKRDLT